MAFGYISSCLAYHTFNKEKINSISGNGLDHSDFVLIPVLDELIGKSQFKKLCIEQAKMQVDEKNVSGKLLIPMRVKKTDLQGYILQTEEKYWSYKDSITGEILKLEGL